MTKQDRDSHHRDSQKEENDFARHVEGKAGSFLGESWYFLRHNKKWWLTPVILALLFTGLLVVLGGTGAAPFIYTLF